MRIEQYFLMTDYSLWEVILKGESPVPTKVIEGVVQHVAPTTAEQRLARKNELKAHGTLLMALPNKNQLKFNIHKDAKNLMEAIEKRFGGNKETKKVQKTLLKQQYENFTGSSSEKDINLKFLRSLPTEWRTHALIWRNKTDLEEQSLDDLFNSLKIYEAEVKSSFSASTSTQNIAFVSSQNTDSTNDQCNTPQLDNDDLKQIDADDLEEMDLKWQMAMLTVRARRFLQRTGRNLGENGPTSMWFDMLKVECYNRHMKGHFARECRSPKDTRRNVLAEPQRRNVPVETSTSNALVSQCDDVGSYDWSFQAEEEPTNYALMAFTSSSSSSSDNELRDNALVVLRQKFKKAKQERDDLKLKLEKFQTSSKNLSQLLASQTNDKTRLGYDNQVFTSSMFDCDELFSSESDVSMPASPIYDRYQSGEGYHAVYPPYTGTFMPLKPNLVFHDAPNVNETVHTAFNVELSPTKPDKKLSHTNRQSAPIIEDWVSDSKDESEAEPSQNDHSFVQPPKQVKTPRPSVKPVEHFILAANHKIDISKPKSHENIRNRMACFLVPLTAARPVTTAIPQTYVTRPRPAKNVGTKTHSPPRRNINHRPSPPASNFPPKVTAAKAPKVNDVKDVQGNWGNPQHALKDKGVIDSGCSRHMTGNMSYLSDFEAINGGYLAFGGNPKGGKITEKGKIKTGKLDFDDVYFVKELKFNLFSVSQMCDKKNSVLFIETECIVLSPEFKLPDENQVLLRVPRENNMYNVNLKNIVPSRDLTCLFEKATLDESNLWHRRLGHINFKTMNKLVKDPLDKFDGMADEGFLVGYSVSSKAFRVFNSKTRIIQETLHINFMKNKPNVAGSGPTWLFDINTLTKSMNYQPVTAGNQYNPSAGVQEQFDAEKAGEENVQQYVLFPLWSSGSKNPQNTDGDATFEVKEHEFEGRKPESEVHVSQSSSAHTKKHDDKTKKEAKVFAIGQISTNSTNTFSAAGPSNTVVSPTHGKSSYMDPSQYPDDSNMPAFEDITYSNDEEDVGAEADFTNLETNITEELLQFKMQKVWVLVDLPNRKGAIGTKWVFRNKKNKRGIVVRNKARLVSQGHTQEEGIDYEEVFAPVARIETIRLFLAYASFMGFMVYQMNVKGAFLYGTIEEKVYVCQPPGFKDPDYHDKVYKVVKALYGLHQAPRAWYETLANYLLENSFQRGKINQTLFIKKQKGDILLVHVYIDDIIFGSTNKDLCKAFEKLMKDKFQMSSMGELTFFLVLQVKQKPDGIFISQDKYVAKILRKFGLTDGKSASTPINTENPLLKDPDGEDVDVHTYRSMISSLMYLTSSRPNIMFAVCAFARFQVTPKASHLHAVKRIFRYLKGKPHLGLWYPKDSPFNLVAYSDSDYVGASLDRKSTTWGSQFLGCRLISWQCEKQTVVATSSNEAEYVAAASCWAQVLWIQNQLLDYGKKVIIAEATVREALQLDDAESIDCLPNEEVFTELSRMGLVRNVDSSSKFYMYPRFLRLMIRAQVGDLSFHTTKYSSPALTQKVFANMRRVGKGFSRVETPLFEGMIVAQQADNVADEVIPTPLPSPIAAPPSPSQQQQPTHDAAISLDLLHTFLETCTTLTRKAKALEQDNVAQALEIIKLKHRVKKLERKNKLKVSGLRRLRKVGTTQRIESFTDTVMDYQEDASKHGEIIANIDADEDVTLKDVAAVEKTAEIEKDADVQGRPETEAQARKNMMIYLRNMDGFKMDYFKGMSYDDIPLIFKKYYKSNVALLEKTKEQMEEEDGRALKRKTESSKEKVAKKQKLDEEVEELKKHLQIVPNDDDDDVYTEATPLALKVSVVDYAIYTENNKPYYKIIRADRSHQLFLSFLSLLKNFDREDLEMILLVERRYPLTRFTLDQMLNNVRLEVEEESEVSLELLRFCLALESMLLKTLKIYTKGLRLLVKDLMLPIQIDAADIKLRLLEQSAAVG
uniref:Putative ribonuclease H-like domain-containing protein n=1 Tax=Tanacetum cinerariifolium TaxID=118510 RepID=A0A6L2LEX2_TANCI|nr:putative ribonuclease H-like domain-containing protein [Tanacetum cinerariifolium]